MKALTLIFTLLVAGAAQAAVNQPGSFVPSMCGKQSLTVEPQGHGGIDEICFGAITGDSSIADMNGVTFRYRNGLERSFVIANTVNLYVAMRNGETKSMFYLIDANGERTTMKVTRSHEGEILTAMGQLDDADYLVKTFEAILSVQ